MRRRTTNLACRVAVAALMIVAGLAVTATAEAAILSCGQTITQSTVLENDVGPCPNNGIHIGADNITLNLNRHRIFGVAGTSGDGAGILIRDHQGVIIQGGTVSDFDGGVVIIGGQGNTVRRVTARNNLGAVFGQPGPAALYGDGILIQGSSNNVISGNQAVNNGPFAGIGVTIGDSDHPAQPPRLANGNTLEINTVTDNVACRRGTTPFCDNDGIRIEPRVGGTCLTGPVICPGPGMRVIGNTVLRNGLDGISLFGFTTNIIVQGNTANANGFQGAVPGDGIRVFGSNNIFQGNTANDNRAGGISVARRPPSASSFPPGNPNGRNNRLVRNTGSGNVLFDLWDSNRLPDCDQNLWSANLGTKVAPPCTLNP